MTSHDEIVALVTSIALDVGFAEASGRYRTAEDLAGDIDDETWEDLADGDPDWMPEPEYEFRFRRPDGTWVSQLFDAAVFDVMREQGLAVARLDIARAFGATRPSRGPSSR